MRAILTVLLFHGFICGSTPAAGNQAEQGQPAGVIIELTGFDEVTAINPEHGPYRNLKVHDPVYAGDKIVTAQEQTVTIELAETSVVMIAPSSTFIVEEYQPGNVQQSTFGLIDGIIRFVVRKKYGPGERFNVRTPASTMGVRGTEFIVQVDGKSGDTQVHVLHGVVAMALNADLLSDEKRAVKIEAGQMGFKSVAMKDPVAPKRFDARKFRHQMWKVSPQLNSKVTMDRPVVQPLPGVRPEREADPKVRLVRGKGAGVGQRGEGANEASAKPGPIGQDSLGADAGKARIAPGVVGSRGGAAPIKPAIIPQPVELDRVKSNNGKHKGQLKHGD